MKTTINGKEIKLYGRNELSVEFTNVVQEYMANGFIFNYSEASSGSQGEVMKTDLSNDGGKTVYRIWMVTDYERIDEERYISVDTLSIIVKKYDGKCSTFWFSDGELISERKLYKVSNRGCRYNAVYCESKDEYMEFQNKRDERWAERKHSNIDRYNDNKELPQKYYKLAINCTKKLKGYKSLQLKDIRKVNRTRYGYDVFFNGGKICALRLTK